jgi:hypothetical protein
VLVVVPFQLCLSFYLCKQTGICVLHRLVACQEKDGGHMHAGCAAMAQRQEAPHDQQRQRGPFQVRAKTLLLCACCCWLMELVVVDLLLVKWLAILFLLLCKQTGMVELLLGTKRCSAHRPAWCAAMTRSAS